MNLTIVGPYKLSQLQKQIIPVPFLWRRVVAWGLLLEILTN